MNNLVSVIFLLGSATFGTMAFGQNENSVLELPPGGTAVVRDVTVKCGVPERKVFERESENGYAYGCEDAFDFNRNSSKAADMHAIVKSTLARAIRDCKIAGFRDCFAEESGGIDKVSQNGKYMVCWGYARVVGFR